MYVYLDFLCAKVGDLLIVGVLRQPFFLLLLSLYILSANV